jgi:hypothetical protein
MNTPTQLTQLEQEVFEYLNDTPNAREARIETLAARISHEMDVMYSEALVIVDKWKHTIEGEDFYIYIKTKE